MSEREPGQLAYEVFAREEGHPGKWSNEGPRMRAAWAAVERAVFRAGQEDMRKRAVEVADPVITRMHGALKVDPWEAAEQVTREIRSAIAELEIKDE